METDLKLIEKRQELKNEITAGINKTPMARFLNYVGGFIQNITRYPKQLPLSYSVFIFLLFILLVTFILFTYPIKNWTIVFRWVIFGQIGVLALIITYFNVNRVLTDIRDFVVDYLMSEQSLSNLQEWLYLGWTNKIMRRFWTIYLVGFSAVLWYFLPRAGYGFSKIGVAVYSVFFWSWS